MNGANRTGGASWVCWSLKSGNQLSLRSYKIFLGLKSTEITLLGIFRNASQLLAKNIGCLQKPISFYPGKTGYLC